MNMKAFLCLITLVLMTSNTWSKSGGDSFSVEAVTYEDGVLLEPGNPDFAMEVIVAAPDGSQSRTIYSASEAAFLPVHGFDGQRLADGLYKYEIVPLPVQLTAKHRQTPPELRGLPGYEVPSAPRISGSFTVLNGLVLDSMVTEDPADQPLEGIQQ